MARAALSWRVAFAQSGLSELQKTQQVLQRKLRPARRLLVAMWAAGTVLCGGRWCLADAYFAELTTDGDVTVVECE